MNSASKHAVIALLVFSITGCAPKNATTAPPVQAQAPTLATGKAGAMYPPPLTESQTQTQPATPPPAPEVAQTQPAPAPAPAPPPSPKKNSSHRTKTSAKPAGSENASTQTGGSENPSGSSASTESADVAAKAEPGSASPIGQLTPADTPEQAQKGKDTSDLIAKTEDGLNSVKRPLSAQEQETVNQIRVFLTKARTALTNQDFDGAFILATKAKVLLDELNKA